MGLSRNKVAVPEGAAGSPPFYGEAATAWWPVFLAFGVVTSGDALGGTVFAFGSSSGIAGRAAAPRGLSRVLPAAGCLVASWLVNWRVDASKILFLVCFFVKLGRSCWSARVCSDRFSLLGHFVLFVVQGFVRCAWMGRLPVHGRSGGCLGA